MRILVLVFLFSLPVLRAQAPVISSPETGWEFGIREQGVSEFHEIPIANDGDADLEITSIKITCGCVKGEMESMVIKPGESSKLKLRLNTAGQIGKIRKFAYIQSNDPRTPNFILQINGEVRGKWDVSTTNLVFNAEAGDTQEQSMMLTIREGERVRLRGVQIKSSHIRVATEERYEEASAKGGGERLLGYEVKITLLPNCPPGNISAVIRIETNDNQVPFRNIAVHARVRGVAKVTPNRLYVGRIFQGKRKTVLLKVTRTDGKEFEVTGASSDLDYVTVHVLPIKDKHEYDVLVTVAPGEGTVEMVGRVTIETTIENSKTMTVDLEGRAAPPR